LIKDERAPKSVYARDNKLVAFTAIFQEFLKGRALLGFTGNNVLEDSGRLETGYKLSLPV